MQTINDMVNKCNQKQSGIKQANRLIGRWKEYQPSTNQYGSTEVTSS